MTATTATRKTPAGLAAALCEPQTWWTATEREVAGMFAGDVAGHAMTVRRDDGLYRHVTFANPGTGIRHFHLTTWPGYLAVSGDMGAFMFTRELDMFGFFRASRYVNTGYWAEKMVAQDRWCAPGGKVYSPAAAKAWLRDQFAEWAGQLDPDGPVDTGIRGHLTQGLAGLLEAADVEDELRAGLEDFTVDGFPDARFSDVWELSWNETDYHLQWVLYAIRWGIGVYDMGKAGEAGRG